MIDPRRSNQSVSEGWLGSSRSCPRWGLHPLKGELAGHWSIWVNGNWRMTFRFDGTDAVLVDYRDYH
jgi:plasmid maintenance system killer protein